MQPHVLDWTIGRLHQCPVGPHRDSSCQRAFDPEQFGEVIPCLALNRAGLVVFIHPLTGNELLDHSDHEIWMGEMRALKLSVFYGATETSEM